MLQLRSHIIIAMLRVAEASPYQEVTGLVTQGKEPRDQAYRPMRNSARDPEHYYAWDPAEMVTAYREMDDREHTPLVFFHSHPSGKPDPSEADTQGAFNADVHYMIAYPDKSIGVWRLSTWQCLEQRLLIASEYAVLP